MRFSARHIARALETRYWETRMGIRTRSGYGQGGTSEHGFYASNPYWRIFQVLDFLTLSENDVLIDLGCGRGRVLCCAALYRLRKAVGIDDVPELVAATTRNAARLRRARTRIEAFRCKAEEFDYSSVTVIYMYNPFGPVTLGRVTARLKDSFSVNPRQIRIAYDNPIHASVLAESGYLECYARWDGVRPVHAVSFWRNKE